MGIKIVRKSVIKLENPEPVFCINVPAHGNFALENGIIVSNCPLVTFAQPKREAWTKYEETNKFIVANDLAHSARKAHKCSSISSLNFKPGEREGYMYMDIVRRGESNTMIPITRDLNMGLLRET